MKEQDQTNQPQEKKKSAPKPNFGLFLGNNSAAAGKPQGAANANRRPQGANRQPQDTFSDTGDKRPAHPRAARPKDGERKENNNAERRENANNNAERRENAGNNGNRSGNAPAQHRRRNEPAAGRVQNAPAAEQQGAQGEKKNQKRGGGKSKRFGNPVKIMFLGGVGEIGKNMTAIEYGNDIIIIDAGLTFPDEELPGIDLVIPDISYLVANRKKIRGILITHGHEDHVGGLPYLLKEISAPVFGTKLTLALADNKLREHRLNKVDMRCVKPKDKIKLGCFGVEFINVNHSIAGALALCIDTPQGRIFHSGDFKIDLTPVAGDQIDLPRISEIGREGVNLLLCESTNVERQGYTMSETVVGTTLDHLFAEHVNRRIIVATFASNVHRLQQIIDLAAKYRRKVALSGRSMLNVVDAAGKIGELNIPEGVLIDVEKIKNYFDREIVIVSTGSQGEPMSALTRMASGDFNKVTIGSNDTIIISASPIPGNEKMVYKVINNLYRKGANVVYESLEKIHVSGHACQEELKIMHSLLKPKFFIPVHGEYRHLKRHSQLAMGLGMSENNMLICDIGNCVELTRETMQFGESVSSGSRLVDGGSLEDRENSEVMKDRKSLSADGIFVITACVSERSGELLSDPEVINRGFVMPENADYASDIRQIVVGCAAQVNVKGDRDNTEYRAAVQKSVKNFIYKKTKQNPVVMVNIIRI